MQRRPPLVRISKAGVQLSEHLLTETRYVIGRNSDADIWLDDGTVSRPHAELIRGPFGRWWVQDLRSTNGTKVSGRLIDRVMLHHRDLVGVGDFIVEFRHVRPDPLMGAAADSQPSFGEDTVQLSSVAPSSKRAGIEPVHLSTLTTVGSNMLATADGQRRLDMLCESFVEALPGDGSMALRLHGDGSSTIISGPFYRHGSGPAPYCSKTLIHALLSTKEAIVATNISNMPASTELSLAEAIRPLTIIACPVAEGDGHMDVLWVEFPWTYATLQWRAVVQLAADSYAQARMVAQMRDDLRTAARVEHDLEMARDVQSRLLPDCTRIEELDVAVGYEPSHWVGGDYVDALYLSDGRVLLIIADVCGKGLSAALVSSSLHTMIRAVTELEKDVRTLVSRVNSYLCAHLPASSFVTMLAIAIDPRTGALECLNAGHPPAVIVSQSGEQRWLQTERNVAVGMLTDADYEVERTHLDPTDTLLMYTDGAFERFGSQAPSIDPLELGATFANIIAARPRATAGELCRQLSAALAAHGGGQLQSDDTTFVVACPHRTKRV